jgi:membrane-bound lytic murein transglycosylase A
VTAEDWAAVCAEAGLLPREFARQFFETRFRPVLVTSAADPLFTAYYEPELQGSRLPVGPYQNPLFARPPDLPNDGSYYWTREQIEAGALDGKRLELFWVADPVDSFFLQIQGSGRIRTEDGRVHRLGYAGKNGHPYRSVGKMLIADGVLTPGQATAEGIKAWVRANPGPGRAYLNRNPSYVFFRELPTLDHALGPLGALEVPLTPYRSAAVDPAVYPLGAPVWVETNSPLGPLRRLLIAQDTGGVIKGAQRADLFFGSGPRAGEVAGRMKTGGRMVVLAPSAAALRVASLN